LSSDLKQIQDKVLRSVGRNLVLFQAIEELLKFLLSHHKVGSKPKDFREHQRERIDAVNGTMLGHLVHKYGTEVLRDAGVEVPEEESPADWITFSVRISGDTDFVEAMRRDMKLMTEQRNELVHGFLARWQPDSPEKLEETLRYLDAQREKVLPMHEHLKFAADQVLEGRQKLFEFLTSKEYQKQSELMWLQASPLVSLLSDVATQIHRRDGWTYLAHAGDLAKKELPEEVKNIKERYGFKTLKTLLVGSEMFDVFDEPLSGGRFRTLYKNKETS
jgi:hypothetical protein